MAANSKNIQLSEQLKNYLWLQCLLCVYDLLARSGLSHLDLKPDNFVFDDNWRLMLIDFGHTGLYNQLTQKETGTFEYQAPEIYNAEWAPYIPL